MKKWLTYVCLGIILFASYDQVLFDSFKVAWPFDKIRIRGALKGYCDMLQDPFRVIEVDCYIDDIFCVHVILLVKRGRQQCRHPHRFSACRQGASGIEVLSPCSRVRPFSSCAHILPCPAS